MRFQGLDLNLLVALEALLQEQNVSVAAERVHVSQSTLSGSLARLREHFGDDLLTPVGRKLVRTPRGESLAGPVSAALAQIKATILTEPVFDPQASERSVSIMASDYAAIVSLSAGMARIARAAPKLTVHLLSIDGHATDKLERGEVDLLVTLDKYISPDHPSELLFQDEYVVVGWAENPRLGGVLSEADYFDLGHVVVRFSDRTPSFEEWRLQSHQQIRRVEAVAPSFALAPYLVVGTERITTMHRRLAETFARSLPLKILAMPFAIPPIRQVVQWRRSAGGDAALAWVRAQLIGRADQPSSP
jgi:DNA-binding transcriptional LysR family regulator